MKKKQATLMLIVTNACNLNCVYCYEKHDNRGTMPLEIAQKEISKVLNDSDKYSFISIQLFGGEPFLCFELVKEICEWTWSHDWKVPYMFIISTNGTMLRENVKKWLLQNKERVRLILSADGDRDSQNHNRSNSYDKIDYHFFKFNWINPEVKMTVSPYSLKNLSNDIIFFHKKGFRFSDCNLAMGIDWSDRHNVATLKNELKKLVTYYIEHPQLTPANIINQEVGRCENKRVMYKWCGVGRELMTVDVDGKKYPCNFITPMTFTEEQLDLLMRKDYTNIRALVDKKCFDTCYLYPICPTCYGADFLYGGSINQKNKSACEVVKVCAYYSAYLQMKKLEKIDISDFTIEDKGKMAKTIRSIRKILSNYEEYGD